MEKMLFNESKNCEKAMALVPNYFLQFKIFVKSAFLACTILPQMVTWQEWMEFVNVGRFSNQWKLSRTFASELIIPQ